jgi:hypothetical protein
MSTANESAGSRPPDSVPGPALFRGGDDGDEVLVDERAGGDEGVVGTTGAVGKK